MRAPLLLAAIVTSLALVLVVAGVNAASAGQPAVLPSPDLLGTWVSAGYNRNFARIVITRSTHSRYGSGGPPLARNWVRVHPYGTCQPTPCDWGVVDARLAVEGGGSSEGIAFSATFDQDFAIVLLTGHLAAGATKLEVDAFTRFTDGSDRADYWASQRLQRRS